MKSSCTCFCAKASYLHNSTPTVVPYEISVISYLLMTGYPVITNNNTGTLVLWNRNVRSPAWLDLTGLLGFGVYGSFKVQVCIWSFHNESLRPYRMIIEVCKLLCGHSLHRGNGIDHDPIDATLYPSVSLDLVAIRQWMRQSGILFFFIYNTTHRGKI